MSVKFPDIHDVPLRTPPLAEVICQLRFHPILSITVNAPAEFQERVRQRFPSLEVQQGVQVEVPPEISGNLRPMVTGKTYRFQADDGISHISLAHDFAALSTTEYTTWGDFSESLGLMFTSLEETYAPTRYTRLGLRYVNLLTYANTGVSNPSELIELVNPALTSMMKTEVWQMADRTASAAVLSVDQAKLVIRSGLQDGPQILLDFDYYEEGRLSSEEVLAKAEAFHNGIYAAFRWCVPPSTLRRFGPVQGFGEDGA